ncbi:MAG: response regulator transcription factor [Desulfobacteraceae bacterium]|jgi:DNA-binding NarL/FixJ family response regulator
MSNNEVKKSLNRKARILIVDDHPIFTMGMIELINQETDLVVCGSADDVSEARRAIKDLKPDLIILDITLKTGNGFDLIEEIVRATSNLPILVLSMHDETLWAERCLRAGAKGYLMKQEAPESVVAAIGKILTGQIHVSDKIMTNILGQMTRQPNSHIPPMNRLTDRELQVLQLIGTGLTTRQIASRMNLSIKTIGTYRERIKEKLGLQSGTELLRFAVLWLESPKKILNG